MLVYAKKWIATAIVLFATAACVHNGAHAQPGAETSLRPAETQPGDKRTVSAVRFTAPPVIDGVVDDECWQSASSTDSLIQFQPQHGEPSPHRTVIFVGFDDRALYVAFVCYDSDPSRIAAALTKRDSDLGDDDAVGIFLDSLNDGYTATAFVTNPLGTQWDFRVTDNGRTMDSEWDGTWEVAVARTAEGWSAEFAIPLRTLKYRGGENRTWGVNFGRAYPRSLETSYWAGPMVDELRVSQYGQLTGLDLQGPVKRIEVIPYAMLQVEEGGHQDTQAGLDARVRVTNALGADVTVSPDFATVEADAEQINLTRFELYLPEKRPFFLEGAEMFQQRVRQFYSRRIGDIPWGAKLSGKLLGWDVSVISARSDPAETAGDTASVGEDATYGVVRLKTGILRSSNVGLLAANREWRGDNQGSAGLDATLFFTETLGFTGQFLRAHGPRNDGAVAWFVRPSFDNSTSHFHVRYSNFDVGLMDNMNAVGFILDDDRKEFDTNLSHEWWFKDRAVEQIDAGVNYNRYTGQTGVLRAWELDSELECNLASKFKFAVEREDEYERFEKEFRNEETRFEVGYDTRAGRSVEIAYGFGRSYDSDLRLASGELALKITDGLNVEYEATRLWLDPDPEDDSTIIHSVRTSYYFNPDLFCKLFFQSNSVIDKENAQVWLVWRFLPPFGSLQLVYQQGTSIAGTQSQQGHTLFTKLSWVF
jgi:hypothetical protein